MAVRVAKQSSDIAQAAVRRLFADGLRVPQKGGFATGFDALNATVVQWPSSIMASELGVLLSRIDPTQEREVDSATTLLYSVAVHSQNDAARRAAIGGLISHSLASPFVSPAAHAATALHAVMEDGWLLTKAQTAQVIAHGMGHDDTYVAQKCARVVGRMIAQGGYVCLREKAWEHCGLREYQLETGGRARSMVPQFIREVVSQPPPHLAALDINVKAVQWQRTTHAALGATYDLVGDPLSEHRTVRRLLRDGRMVVVKQPDARGLHMVAREASLLHAAHARDLGLRSRYPEPLPTPDGQPALWRIGQARGCATITHPSYYRYLNDPTLSFAEFRHGLLAAVHDAFLWARYGYYHTVPSRNYHNRDGNRTFVVWPDIMNNSDSGGMGRQDDWIGALDYSNFGADGLRDLEEMFQLAELKHEHIGVLLQVFEFYHQVRKQPNVDALIHLFLQSNVLYTGALHLALRVRQYAEREDVQQNLWQDDRRLAPFGTLFLEMLATAYAVEQDISDEEAMAVMRRRVPWQRAMTQMALFATPAHATEVKPGQLFHKFPTARVFGPRVRLTSRHRQLRSFHGYQLNDHRVFDPTVGFIGEDNDPSKPALGPFNGPSTLPALEEAIGAVFI